MALKEELKCLLIEIKQALETHPDQYKCLSQKIQRFLSDIEDKFKLLVSSGRPSASENQFLQSLEGPESLASFNSRVENGSTSQEEAIALKSTVSEAQLKLDFYVMEIDNNRRSYSIVPIKQSGPSDYINQLGDLILSEIENHVTKLQLFFQVTQRTSSSPSILKPIVFQLLQSQKYVFIFETKQYLRKNNYYEESDRFFIFVLDEFLPMTVIEIVKKIVKMEYTDRFWLGKNSYHLDYSVTSLQNRKVMEQICRGLRQDMQTFIDGAQLYYFRKDGNQKLQKKIQSRWYLRSLPTYSLLAKVSEDEVVNLSLLSVLLFYVFKDYKVVMIGVKEKRHIMSEIIMGLKFALLPIKYTYPTIFASVSENHNNYMDTPIPSLVMLWGNKEQCEQIINCHEKSIRIATKFDIPTILIDLNSRVLINKPLCKDQGNGLKYIDMILKTPELAQKYQKPTKITKFKDTIVDKAHNFIFEGLIAGKATECKQLQLSFKETYIFKNYSQGK